MKVHPEMYHNKLRSEHVREIFHGSTHRGASEETKPTNIPERKNKMKHLFSKRNRDCVPLVTGLQTPLYSGYLMM